MNRLFSNEASISSWRRHEEARWRNDPRYREASERMGTLGGKELADRLSAIIDSPEFRRNYRNRLLATGATGDGEALQSLTGSDLFDDVRAAFRHLGDPASDAVIRALCDRIADLLKADPLSYGRVDVTGHLHVDLWDEDHQQDQRFTLLKEWLEPGVFRAVARFEHGQGADHE